MSLQEQFDAADKELNDCLLSGDYNPELIEKQYRLAIAVAELADDKEVYIPYNQR